MLNRKTCCCILFIVVAIIIIFNRKYSEKQLINTDRLWPQTIKIAMNNFVPYSRHSVHSENDAIVKSQFSSRFASLRLPSILNYSEKLFRLSINPILWLDDHGDVRWNRPAQLEFVTYLNNKQTLEFNALDEELIYSCPDRDFFILQQHHYGFFSRYHCFIEQFGQTLYSPRMTLLSYRRFIIPQPHVDDFLDEGILRYFQPFATCSNHLDEPQMKRIELQVKLNSTTTEHVKTIDNLFDQNWKTSEQFVVLDTEHVWHFGYQDVPIRRWLFDFDPIPFTYDLTRVTLVNHQREHIYRSPILTKSFLDHWLSRNRQWKEPKEHLVSRTYTMTWQDHVFTSFLRYMFIVYFHRFTFRIENLAQLLADHWSSYLMDKNRLSLRDAAAIFIRRGDKSIEDSFWKKYGRWRNISFYVKGLVDEETRRNRRFSSVFIMTDDLSVSR